MSTEETNQEIDQKAFSRVCSESSTRKGYGRSVALECDQGRHSGIPSVRTQDNQAWGAVTRGDGRTQAQVNEDASALCAKFAADKGIDKACALHTPAAKK